MLATVISAVVVGLGAAAYSWWRIRKAEEDRLHLAGLDAYVLEALRAERHEKETDIASENARRDGAVDPADWR